MPSRRTFVSLMGTAACVGGAVASPASAPMLDLGAISLAAHEAAMRLAIAAAKANPFYPFGAVIIGAADRAVLAQGVNSGKTNPILHAHGRRFRSQGRFKRGSQRGSHAERWFHDGARRGCAQSRCYLRTAVRDRRKEGCGTADSLRRRRSVAHRRSRPDLWFSPRRLRLRAIEVGSLRRRG